MSEARNSYFLKRALTTNEFNPNKMKNNTTDNLTKDQALKAMLEGKKVQHKYFASDEWVTLTKSGNYKFEDGCEATPDFFWLDRTSNEWETGWSIFELNEREQTEGKTKEEIAEILMGSENLTASIIILNEFINNQTTPLLKQIEDLEQEIEYHKRSSNLLAVEFKELERVMKVDKTSLKAITHMVKEKDKLIEELTKENEWISVKDRLPEKDGRYIVIATDYEIFETPFNNGKFGCFYEGKFITASDGLITHWRKLPQFQPK